MPDPSRSITGGNLVNAALAAALTRAGIDVVIRDRDAALRAGPATEADVTIVDSLYLDAVPSLVPCTLLAHYLPSLVDGTDAPSTVERAALAAAERFIAPSAWMAEALAARAPSPRSIVVMTPAIDVGAARRITRRSGRAILVANLVPAKGVLHFLEALGGRPLDLTVVGTTARDPDYAEACRRAAPQGTAFLGEIGHEEALVEIASSDFLISASCMESFGLALGEARALGVPIVARVGGNVAAHVDATAGGELAMDVRALADACVALAADREALERRRLAARRARPPERSWDAVAAELVRALSEARAD